jgi:hypothetical protein
MSRLKKEGYKVSRRNRECWMCGGIIRKGEKYVFREERYDRTIISYYWHNCSECKPVNIKDIKS